MGNKAELIAETVLILALFTAILYLGPGAASGHRMLHEFPMGYGASDAFQHEARSEAIRQMGDYREEAPYMMGGLTGIIGFYPPILYHVTALLSGLSGLPTYDSLFLIIGLALALSAIVAYYLAKNLGVAVALLSIPLTLFVATGKPFLGMMTFGQMPFALASLFLVATAWSMTKLGLPKSYLLIPIFLAGAIMTHTSEAIFLFIMLAAVFGALAVGNFAAHRLLGIKKVVTENKNLLLGLALTAIPTLYFLPMFIGIWLKVQPYHFNVETVSASFPAATFYPTDFGFMLAAIVAGLIAAVLLIMQKRKELGNIFSNPKLFTILFSSYMILAGLGTYFGFGLRSFQTRLFWPITLAPLAGFGIYQVIRLVTGLLKKNGSIVAAAAVLAILLSVAVVARYYTPTSTGSMDKNHWDAMEWIANNTPDDARPYFFFSPAYSQTSVLYNTERVSYFLEFENYAKLVNQLASNDTANRTTPITIASDSGTGMPYRTGLFSFEQRMQDNTTSGKVDICNSKYFVVDLAVPDQLSQANNFLIQKLVSGDMAIAYQNPAVVILSNNNIGGECLG